MADSDITRGLVHPDDWMELTGGGSRESEYRAPVEETEDRGWMDRFRREAAEFKARRIDRIIETGE